MQNKIKVYLGSASPRRRQMLSQVFNNMESFSPLTKEPRWQINQDPKSYIRECVETKFQAAVGELKSRSISSGLIVVADTIVNIDRVVLGKPENKLEAIAMLSQLSGRWHTVSSAYKWRSFSGSATVKDFYHVEDSRVKFKKLKRSEILKYVRTGEPMDKAGAYGVQGGGLAMVERITGSYQNIAGFPLFSFVKSLERHGVKGF
ncbi:septum formation protein Maf [bacterium]|nr:septum formation protein Maf [bacterium]